MVQHKLPLKLCKILINQAQANNAGLNVENLANRHSHSLAETNVHVIKIPLHTMTSRRSYQKTD